MSLFTQRKLISADKQTGANLNTLWFYELHAIPQWHHDPTKCGALVLKPDWCLTDHAGTGVLLSYDSYVTNGSVLKGHNQALKSKDCLAYVFGWCLGREPGQGIVPTAQEGVT